MAPTTLIGQKTSTCPYGREPALHGYPLKMTEIAATLEGTTQVLTDDSSIAMYPHATSGKIVFSTPAGEAFIINVTK